MSQLVFILLCALVTCALAIVTAIRIFPLIRLLPVKLLSAFSISMLLGSLGTIFSLTAPTFDEKVFWFYLRVLGTLFIAPLWLLFLTSAFERWRWLAQPKIAILLFAPCVANFLVVLSPAARALVFTKIEPFTYGNISFLRFQYGNLYDLFYAWSLAIMLLSFALSAVAYWHERGFRQRQVLILNAGFGAAVVFAFLPSMELGTEELRWLASSCFSFLVTQIGILYAVFRQRLLSIEPLAAARNFQRFPDPVFVVDDRENVMGASNRAITFFNLPKDYLGQKLKRLLPDLMLTSGEQILIDNHQKNHSFHLTVENLGEKNNSPGSLVFFRDINMQKLNERKLQDGIEFRARLLAFLAHDLTGLLENQAFLSLSLQSKINVEQHPEASLLTSSALAAQELVENIMVWVQNQVVGFQPIVRPFEWNLLLKEALEQIEGRLKVSGIRLNFQSHANQLFGEGDSEMLAAVFRNLVSNAIRATPRGKSLHIVLRADQSHAFVSVRDEGHGIEPAKLDNILAVSKEFLLGGVPEAEGSGIGLMIARQFITLHNGTFEMKSNLGFGTEVSFSVPL